MSGINASIPLQVRPTEQIDFAKTLANSQAIMGIRQQQEQEQRQNALLSLFKDPKSIDATGNPTPETIQKTMAIDPPTGLKLRQNAMISQEHALRSQVATSELTAKKMDLINENYAPVLEQYEDALKAGAPIEQAKRDAQASLFDVNKRMSELGLFSPEELKRQPQEFDPIKMRVMVGGAAGWQNYIKEQQAAQRERDVAKHYGAMGATQIELKNGRTAIYHPNAEPGKEYTFAGTDQLVPPEMLEGVTKVGTAGRGGSKDEILKQVRSDVKSDPNFEGASEGEVGLEALRRMHNAGQGGSIADDPEALKFAADFFEKNGKMPVGFRNRQDQDAVIKELGKRGTNAGDVAAAGATTTADTRSLGRLTQQRDAIAGYEKGASGEFDLALKYLPKTAEPFNSQLLTGWVRSGERQFGNVPNAQFYTALTSALDEYAKVLSGGTGSAAASTDSARRQALSIIPPGATTAQIGGIIKVIKQTMDIKKSGYDDQIKDIQTRLRGTSKSDKPADKGGQTGATGGPPTITHDDKGKAAYDALPPGAEYIGPDGNTYRKKAPAGGTAPAQPGGDQGTKPGFGPLNPTPGAPQTTPTQGQAPTAPTTESRSTDAKTAPEQQARTVPPEGVPVPEKFAQLPDGQTFDKGKYIKRGGRIYLNANQGADQSTALTQAREAIKMGAPREAVEKRLRDAGVDPSNL